ncbi:MAG: hypothetical protein WDM92_10290 [Caulobacteraceae bacterium]
MTGVAGIAATSTETVGATGMVATLDGRHVEQLEPRPGGRQRREQHVERVRDGSVRFGQLDGLGPARGFGHQHERLG